MVYGATFFNSHTTMLRGSAIAGHAANVTAAHLVAHELAHIYLHSTEQLVDAQATTWINTHTVRNETVIAQR
ncbi:MAG TPA: hypothetical protein VK608_06345 [Edaphobacter sp.]|nr:hypothetical protein [Edaphobacter sp.]